VTPCLRREPRGLAIVVLSQPDPDLLRQRHQGATGRLVEPAVGRVSDGFFVRFVDILSTADVGCGLDGQRYALPTSPQPPQPG
jgi:hypothetical protein